MNTTSEKPGVSGGHPVPKWRETLQKTLFTIIPFLEPAHDHVAARGWPKWAIAIVGLALGWYVTSLLCDQKMSASEISQNQTNSYLRGQIAILKDQLGDVTRDRDKYQTQLVFWQALPAGMVSIVSNLAQNYSSEPSNRAQIAAMLSDITNMVARGSDAIPRFDFYINGNRIQSGVLAAPVAMNTNGHVALMVRNTSARTARGVSILVSADAPESIFVPEPNDGWSSGSSFFESENRISFRTGRFTRIVVSQNAIAPRNTFSASFNLASSNASPAVRAFFTVYSDDSERQDYIAPLIAQ